MDVNQNATSIEISVLRENMEINLVGLIQTTIGFIPLLGKSDNGVILNVSSDTASNAYQAKPDAGLHFIAYITVARRLLIHSYTIALAQELKKDRIKVNAVTPGFTTSKINLFMPGKKSLEDGALALVPFTLLDKNGPTGQSSIGMEWSFRGNTIQKLYC